MCNLSSRLRVPLRPDRPEQFSFLHCWEHAPILLLLQPSYTYLWSFLFKTYSTAQNSFLLHNLILGLIAPIAVAAMSIFEGTVSDIAMYLGWILSLVPQFALGYGFFNMSFMELYGVLDDVTYTPLSMRIAGTSLVYMAVSGVVYFLAVLVLER